MTDGTAEELGRRIAEVVAARRAARQYDGDLESWMDEHYRRIVGRGADPPFADVLAATARLQGQPSFHLPDLPDSRLPGGAAAHRVVGVAIRGHLSELVDQLNAFADSVRDSVTALSEVVTLPRQIYGHLQAMDDRLAEMQRTVNRLADASDTSDTCDTSE